MIATLTIGMILPVRSIDYLMICMQVHAIKAFMSQITAYKDGALYDSYEILNDLDNGNTRVLPIILLLYAILY